jgi:hypothetical protein
MLRTFSRGAVVLLLLGLAALAVSAVVLAASGPRSSGPSSNYTGPPVATPAQVQAHHGSNIPRALRSASAATPQHASNRVTTP